MKYNHFNNEIDSNLDNGQASFGTFIKQMFILALLVVLAIIYLK